MGSLEQVHSLTQGETGPDTSLHPTLASLLRHTVSAVATTFPAHTLVLFCAVGVLPVFFRGLKAT